MPQRNFSGSPMSARRAISIVVGITDPVSTVLIQGQLSFLKNKQMNPTLLCSPGKQARDYAKDEGVSLVEIPMVRSIKPIKDFLSLFQIYLFFRSAKPDIVNAGTPKAGLLCILAAALCGIRSRVYTMRGLRYESETGIFKCLLMFFEYLSCKMAKKVICISPL